jgi:hypothetical protein
MRIGFPCLLKLGGFEARSRPAYIETFAYLRKAFLHFVVGSKDFYVHRFLRLRKVGKGASRNDAGNALSGSKLWELDSHKKI